MPDNFHDKAADWDTQPVPVQISRGVSRALLDTVALDPAMTVLDFGAGTHAGVGLDAGNRDALERLCRYLLRPPLARGRLVRREDGTVEVRLKRT